MSRIFRVYQRLNDVLAWGITALAIAIIAFAVVSLFGGAVERHVTGRGYAWMNDLPPLLLPWAVFPLMAVLARRGGHVTVDILPTYLKGRSLKLLHIFVSAVVLVAATAFTYGGFHALSFFMRMEAHAPVGFELPMWWIYTSFPVGFALLANFAFESLIRSLLALGGAPTAAVAEAAR